jgi:hypothetical protein
VSRAALGPCPVVTEFFGPHPCVEPVSFRLMLRCDAGHVRVLEACDFHSRVASEDDPGAVCLECDKAGSPAVRVRFVSAEPLPSPSPDTA